MVCFTESFSEDLKRLGMRLGVDLKEKRERSFKHADNLHSNELDLLRERLQPEYEMMCLVREGLGS